MAAYKAHNLKVRVRVSGSHLINALIAQMVEHLFYKQDVIGSNPIQCTYNAKVTQLVE